MTDTQPESEIGAVAWRGDAQDGARKFTAIQRVAEIWSEQRLAVQPLYSQARIDADAATIAALRHDVESAGALRLRLNAYRNRAEAAEARVKELEAALEPFSDIDGEGDEDFDGAIPVEIRFGRSVVYRPVTLGDFRRARRALASKKETVDGQDVS